MAEDTKVGGGTSSTTRSAKNFLASVDMAEDAEVGEGDDGDDETVERSPSKKPNVPTGYLTSLRSDADSAPFAKRWVSLDSFDYGWGSQLEALPKWLRAKFAGTTNWTLIRSAGPTSSLDTTLHRLSSNDLRAPVRLWVAHPLWAWHLSTECSSTERITILSDLSISLRLLFLHQVFICRTHVILRAILVLQYVSNQTSQ